MPDAKHFLSKVLKTESCWLWQSSKSHNGYGRYKPLGVKQFKSAHRVSYEIFVGKISKGLQLDHLCRNRVCVNPKHLEPVTARENILRSIGVASLNSKKTHCFKGHEFTPENTGRQTKGRFCIECKKLLEKGYRNKRKNEQTLSNKA